MRNLRLVVTVKCIAGSHVREVCCDLCELADRMGCMVEAECNGVLVCAHPGDNPLRLLDAFDTAAVSTARVKMAIL